MPGKVPDRAVLFVDGSNWYHGLRSIGETDLMRLNYARVSEKLVGPRTWVGTRYYIGRVEKVDNSRLHQDQLDFVAAMRGADLRITIHYGRIERQPTKNPLADELLRFLGELKTPIDRSVHHTLVSMAMRHKQVPVYREKATDVHLATDLVTMAIKDEYDAAYILSADGDYTPAVELVLRQGKKVYAASAQPGARLASVVTRFIPIRSDWLRDCYD